MLANNVEALVGLPRFARRLIHVIEYPIKNLHQNIESSLITPDRRTMMMVTVEDRKSQADQWCLGVALQKLSVGAANQIVHRLREEQRAHMPKIFAGVHMTILSEWRSGQQCFSFLLPWLSAIGRKNVYRSEEHTS